jgi:uncharacterized protein YkwD
LQGEARRNSWEKMAFHVLIKSIMTIILRRACLLLFLIVGISTLSAASSETERVTASAVIREMNLARQNPALYATFVEDLRSRFNGKFLVLPGQTRIYTHEGLGAVDEAIRFLRSVDPMQPLTLSPGMCKGAADHCADQAGGGFGHNGTDRSRPGDRISRYGVWSLSWGENIAYGKMSARDIVLALIIDDGLRARKHRKNIFSPKFNYAGAAYGPHARYRSICSIDFAGGYTEHGQAPSQALVARNF